MAISSMAMVAVLCEYLKQEPLSGSQAPAQVLWVLSEEIIFLKVLKNAMMVI